jgi:hypothetical protein
VNCGKVIKKKPKWQKVLEKLDDVDGLKKLTPSAMHPELGLHSKILQKLHLLVMSCLSIYYHERIIGYSFMNDSSLLL